MVNTYLSESASHLLRRGAPWVAREEILSMEGTPEPGEPVRLVDPAGHALGVADLDLHSKLAIRRLGLPSDHPEGIIQRHLRRAFERRATLVDDPRYCRVVHDDGDGLPGLIVDRFDQHFAIQTFSRAMDARLEEVARSIIEIVGSKSITIRNDSPHRALLGLKVSRAHVFSGTPPRWLRVMELGARLVFDLQLGAQTGYFYDLREVASAVARFSQGARVLDATCFVGNLLVHAGRAGARQVVGFEADADAVELAQENAESNGLLGRSTIRQGDALSALSQLAASPDPFDLVILTFPDLTQGAARPDEAIAQLLGWALKATRHGGKLILIARHPPSPGTPLDDLVADACEKVDRLAYRVARPGLPPDFPTVIGSPSAEALTSLVVEVL